MIVPSFHFHFDSEYELTFQFSFLLFQILYST